MSRFAFTSDDERVQRCAYEHPPTGRVHAETLSRIEHTAASLRYMIRDSDVRFTVHLEPASQPVIREQIRRRWATDSDPVPPPDDAQMTAWLLARGLDLRYDLTFLAG